MPLTQEEKNQYIESGGVYCPVCQSRNVTGTGHDLDENVFLSYVICMRCGATWTDTYTLTNVVLDEEEEDND